MKTIMTADEYRQHPGNGQSDLKRFHRSPQLYKELRDQKWQAPTPSEKMLQGTRVECFMRSDYQASGIVIVPNSVLTSNGQKRGKAYQEWLHDHSIDPERAVTKKQYDELHACYDAIRKNISDHEFANWVINSGEFEWHNRYIWKRKPDDPFELKAELDLVNHKKGIVIDLKLCTDPSHDAFSRKIEEMGYHIQGAQYTDAASIGSSVQPNWIDYAFGVIAIRSTPPFDVECWDVDPLWLERGAEVIDKTCDRLRNAIENDYWHSPTWGRLNPIVPPRFDRWEM